MTSNNEQNDQAYELRTLMEQIDQTAQIEDEASNRDYRNNEEHVSVLDLPPRSQVHDNKKTRFKWKISFPLVRLLFVVFIIIIILVLTYQIWGKDLIKINDTKLSENPASQEVTIVDNQQTDISEPI